jgi:pilus assembly protein Flp/PilA
MTNWVKALWKDEEAPAAVEYALLVALIAVLIIVGARTLGTTVNGKLNTVAGNVANGQ